MKGKFAPLVLFLNIFFQRAKISLSLNAAKQKMLNSSNIMSKSKGTGLCQQCWFFTPVNKS